METVCGLALAEPYMAGVDDFIVGACSPADFAKSSIGVAVAPSVPRPDVSTIEGLKSTLLPLSCSMPSTGITKSGWQALMHLSATSHSAPARPRTSHG